MTAGPLSEHASPPGPPCLGPLITPRSSVPLEYGVILLLWLFFMWVIRAVWVEVRPLKRRRRKKDANEPTVVGAKGRRGKVLRLHVIRPEEEAGRIYDIGDEVTVGRAAGCGVPIDYDTYSSNLHARLFRLDGDLWAEGPGLHQRDLGEHHPDQRAHPSREG